MRRSLGFLFGRATPRAVPHPHWARALACAYVCVSALACSKLKLLQQAKANEPVPAAAASSTPPPHAAEKPKESEEHATKPRTGRYALPFAWEASEAEPLAKTRNFLREVLGDNQRNVARGLPAFKPFAEKQAPRATVITCADSRVQSNAWDQTPENDDFVVRNIGNQVPNALGSLAYGVEELGTPVLLVIGHTGCGAVRAAMNKLEGLEGPIKKELEGLQLPELKSGSPNQVWAAAVIANVNQQVSIAVDHFGQRIQEGNLTIIGAVYDFRNDLRGGAGKLHLVNVNANTEPERMKAFAGALLLGTPLPSPEGREGKADGRAPLASMRDVPKSAPTRPHDAHSAH